MTTHYPNPSTYRPWLGGKVNEALIRIVMKKNETALKSLSVSDYLEKMIAYWWEKEFPSIPVPFKTKRFDKDLNIVQSAQP